MSTSHPRRRLRQVVEEVVSDSPNAVVEPVVETPVYETEKTQHEIQEHHHHEPETAVVHSHVVEASPSDVSPAVSQNYGDDDDGSHASVVVKSRGAGVSFKLMFGVTIITALAVGFVAGGVYVYLSGIRDTSSYDSGPTPTPLATVEPDETPTPSSTPKGTPVAVGTLKVDVLNGSGKVGEAGKAKTMLEKAGFKVSHTGNASSYNFTKTVVSVKAGMNKEVYTLAQEALSSYKVEQGDALPASSTYDVVITLGSL